MLYLVLMFFLIWITVKTRRNYLIYGLTFGYFGYGIVKSFLNASHVIIPVYISIPFRLLPAVILILILRRERQR
jgi:hypothetical protein